MTHLESALDGLRWAAKRAQGDRMSYPCPPDEAIAILAEMDRLRSAAGEREREWLDLSQWTPEMLRAFNALTPEDVMGLIAKRREREGPEAA